MKKINIISAILICVVLAYSGDDASGNINYKINLGSEYGSYEMTEKDYKWSKSLVTNLKYEGKPIHFVKTTLPLYRDGVKLKGMVYQSIEDPKYFYVLESDAILKIGLKYPYSPGCGGFSMHAPKSKNFIVCLNLYSGGVPFLKGTPVDKNEVTWKGHKEKRI